MGLINKIKKFFKKEPITIPKEVELIQEKPEPIVPMFLVNIIHINPNVYLAHRAARICIGKEVNPVINERMKSLENIIGVNKHESVSEHTNVIAVLIIPNHYISNKMDDYSEFLSNLKYCNYSISHSNSEIYILIGGSARAYMHAIRSTKPNNFFLNYIKILISSSFEKCFFKSLIDDGMIDANTMTYQPNASIKLEPSKVTQIKNEDEDISGENYDAVSYIEEPEEQHMEHVDLVYSSPINLIYNKIKTYGFSLKDVYKVATLSFIFHDISRSCSHQLVRHRNAISQESQRYVTHPYNNNDFVDPLIMMKNVRYLDPKYDVVLTKVKTIDLFKTYNWLISSHINKEDARAYLPTNVKTRLMMSMTYEHYATFLQLRLDKAAQKEIRDVAEESVNLVMDPSKVYEFITYALFYDGLKKELTMDPLMIQYPTTTEVDELLEEKLIEPTSMKVDSQESAQSLLETQEKYRNIKEEDI